MDFLFATPTGTAAFPARSKRHARERAFERVLAHWIKTGRWLPMCYLGPVHPSLTRAMIRAKPDSRAAYRRCRDAMPVPGESLKDKPSG